MKGEALCLFNALCVAFCINAPRWLWRDFPSARTNRLARKKALVPRIPSRHDAKRERVTSISGKDKKFPVQIRARILRDLESSAFPDPIPAFDLPNTWDKGDKRRRVAWRETDLRRAIGAAKRAGLRFYSVEVAPDGTISIVVGEQSPDARVFRLRQRVGKSTKH